MLSVHSAGSWRPWVACHAARHISGHQQWAAAPGTDNKADGRWSHRSLPKGCVARWRKPELIVARSCLTNHSEAASLWLATLKHDVVGNHQWRHWRVICCNIEYLNFSMQNLHPSNTHTHTRLTALFPGLPGWASTRKVQSTWILLKQETVGGSGISWAICKSAPRFRRITTPAPHHSVFYRPDALPAAQPTASKHWSAHQTLRLFSTLMFFTGRMPFLPPNQQHQSTEGTQSNMSITRSIRKIAIFSFNGKAGSVVQWQWQAYDRVQSLHWNIEQEPASLKCSAHEPCQSAALLLAKFTKFTEFIEATKVHTNDDGVSWHRPLPRITLTTGREGHLCRVAGNTVWSHVAREFP